MRVKHLVIVAAVALAAACEDGGIGTTGISAFGGTGGATHLVFTVQPSTTVAGVGIVPAVKVTAATSSGSADPTFVSAIVVTLGTNPGGGSLSGTRTVTANAGVATFSNLSISAPGNGYTLTANATNLGSVTSVAFSVTP